jgi:hypothetical protein
MDTFPRLEDGGGPSLHITPSLSQTGGHDGEVMHSGRAERMERIRGNDPGREAHVLPRFNKVDIGYDRIQE